MQRSRPVILVVEDDQATRTGYRTLLEGEGFDVLVAQDGAEGVERARADAPDLVMTDVMLPVLSGSEIAARLKNDERTSQIPIVALTARTIGARDEWMHDAHWDAFLTKPCLPEELVACIKSLLYDRARASSRSMRAAH